MTDARPHRPYVDPTTVDPNPRPQPPQETPAWQQASKRRHSGSTPAPRPQRPRVQPPQPTASGYFTRHWRGELSLARSYWVNNVLLATPFAFALTGLMSWISVKGDSLQVSAITVLVGMPLLVALNIWCLVGAWRAATHYLSEQGSKLWGWLARGTLALGALQLALSVLLGLLPNVGEFWQMARGVDPLGQATISLSADGRSVRLEGVIGMGDGERLRALLASDAARGIKRVELVSPGGRVREAERMASALKKHGHGARAVGTCASACTLVFLGGNPRHLAPEGQLGFHRASTGTYNPVFEELANQELAKSYRELGLPEVMIDKTLDTPSRGMWFVPRKELVAHQLIAPSPQTLAIPLPPAGTPAARADIDDALRMHPVWEALERRTLGTVDAVAQAMSAARTAGAADDDVQAAALRPLAKQMPELLGGTDPILRRRYVSLVADQLRALRTPARAGERPACRDLLDGRLAARKQLPVELQAREAQWLLDAAQSAPPRWLPKPPSAIEVEVVSRTVGSASLGMLSQLWADIPDTAAGSSGACEPVIAMLERFAAQTPARRDLAERLALYPRR